MQLQICRLTNMRPTTNLGKYLGVPLVLTRPSKHMYQYIIDKVQQRLSGWKARQLTMVGKCTLIQSVLAGIPSYLMQAHWLPQSTCNALNRLNRNFLWRNHSNSSCIHTIGWKQVLLPKTVGGLGLRDARTTNISLLAKRGERWSPEQMRYGLRCLELNI